MLTGQEGWGPDLLQAREHKEKTGKLSYLSDRKDKKHRINKEHVCQTTQKGTAGPESRLKARKGGTAACNKDPTVQTCMLHTEGTERPDLASLSWFSPHFQMGYGSKQRYRQLHKNAKCSRERKQSFFLICHQHLLPDVGFCCFLPKPQTTFISQGVQHRLLASQHTA